MQFHMDPCGIICVFLIYCCVAYADYVVAVWMVIPIFGDTLWAAVHVIVFNTILFFALLSHGRAMLADPGVVPINKYSKSHDLARRLDSSSSGDDSGTDVESMILRGRGGVGDDWTMCTRCESFRPPRAHHCRICRRCIRKMDHHCPWVNNCVGEFNQKYFLQFLLYVGLASIYALFVIIISWAYDDEHATTGLKGPFGENAHHTKVLHSIFLSMASVMFGMFVLAVSCDQLSAIFSEETAIETLQRKNRQMHKRPRRRTRIALLADVCGGGPVFTWLFPCSTYTDRPGGDSLIYSRDGADQFEV